MTDSRYPWRPPPPQIHDTQQVMSVMRHYGWDFREEAPFLVNKQMKQLQALRFQWGTEMSFWSLHKLPALKRKYCTLVNCEYKWSITIRLQTLFRGEVQRSLMNMGQFTQRDPMLPGDSICFSKCVTCCHMIFTKCTSAFWGENECPGFITLLTKIQHMFRET